MAACPVGRARAATSAAALTITVLSSARTHESSEPSKSAFAARARPPALATEPFSSAIDAAAAVRGGGEESAPMELALLGSSSEAAKRRSAALSARGKGSAARTTARTSAYSRCIADRKNDWLSPSAWPNCM